MNELFDDSWEYLIVDEAHLISNLKRKGGQSVLAWNGKKILVTGTPIRNGLHELEDLLIICAYIIFWGSKWNHFDHLEEQ